MQTRMTRVVKFNPQAQLSWISPKCAVTSCCESRVCLSCLASASEPRVSGGSGSRIHEASERLKSWATMWRGRAGAPSLLLALAFCLCCSGSLQGQELYELSPPVNLSVKSHNFRTVLKWDVVVASRTSWFNVEFRDYDSGVWKPFSPCLNISTHHCDLSEAFKPPLHHENSYYARIKAVTTSQDSVFAYTDRFSFRNNATLGPPNVYLTANGNELAVQVEYTDPNSTASSIKKAFKKLTCNIYYWKREAPKPKSKKECLWHITVTEGVSCVSAEVQLDKLNLKGKRSQETCLLIQPSNSNLSVAVPATIGGIVILLLVFAIIYVAYKFNKKELELPKSLAHIILGGKAYTSVSMKTEESSICVVTKLEEVVTNDCEVDLSDERQVEMIKASSDNVDADPVNADVDDSEPVNADLNDPYAAKIGISGTDQKSVREDNIEVGSDLDSTHDLCKTNSDNMKQICVADNWGYDKPQIPFDMFLNNCTDSVN